MIQPVPVDEPLAGGRTSAGSLIAVSYAALQTPIGLLQLFGTARGLLTIVLPNESRAAAERRLRRLLGPLTILEDEAAHADALAQLTAYFAAARRSFDVALDPRGTPFQRLVWDAVAGVPYGETRSYAQIAHAIGHPAAVRAVGAANGANPLPPIIPCHRIVGSDGALTGYGGGLETKRQLLDLEQAGLPS